MPLSPFLKHSAMTRFSQHQKPSFIAVCIALAVVFVLCWGNRFSLVKTCQLSDQHSQVTASTDSVKHTSPDSHKQCDHASHLLKVSQLDISALALFVVFIGFILHQNRTARQPSYRYRAAKPKRRCHSLFCLFLE
tara:strand:- start:2653 stop:3057 length:405 start_codon:yes stop_codon:yes gene_type:complete